MPSESDADMLSKLDIVEEEADEAQFWLELLVYANIARLEATNALTKELQEVISIVVASRRTLKKRIDTLGSSLRESTAEYDA